MVQVYNKMSTTMTKSYGLLISQVGIQHTNTQGEVYQYAYNRERLGIRKIKKDGWASAQSPL
jgi:hypothetical protein